MNRIKYPRTYHLPFSQGITSDDKVLKSFDSFINEEIIITEKMDGENCSIYRDYIHARSIDGIHHPSRDWVKAYHASIKFMIPEHGRICGENMYAQHSIQYDDLESYFYGFSYWVNDKCFSWNDTLALFEALGIKHPKVLYQGLFDLDIIHNIINDLDTTTTEGIVCRVTRSFMYEEFEHCVAKWVRKDHVDSDEHWMHKEIIPNKLRK